MNKRIAKVRNDKNLNQQEFADQLGLTKNYVSLIETGKRIPSDRTITDICREFSVNKDWLLTGEGDPYIELSREAQITRLVGDAMMGEPLTDQQRFLNALLGATPEELHAIAQFAQRLAAQYENEKVDD